MSAKKRILIFCDFYLPSKGAGGGVSILANIVEQLSDYYEFFVVTRNQDSRSDKRPFTNIVSDTWTTYEKANVYYFSYGNLNSTVVNKAVEYAKPDLAFVNSVFCSPSVLFFWQRWKGKFPGIPVVISPCGELMAESLVRKRLKKSLFLVIARLSGLYRSTVWRASSQREVESIRKVFGRNTNIQIAPEIISQDTFASFDIGKKPIKEPGAAGFVYVARILPGKNLLFLLEILSKVTNGTVNLTIVGPVEDLKYWAECESLIARLPVNVRVECTGLQRNSAVLEHLRNSHFFVLPTLTENFGYSLLEALAAGCPLLISDRTDWNDVNSRSAGWSIPLEDRDEWLSTIDACIRMEDGEYRSMANNARTFAETWAKNSESVRLMYSIFDQAIGTSKAK
jgi:glycosyltransferase involved in cell wall biosynthesis